MRGGRRGQLVKKKHGQDKSSNLGRLRLHLHLSLAIGEGLGRQRVPSTYRLQTSRTRLAFSSPRSLRPSVPSPGVSHLLRIGTVWAQVPQYLTLGGFGACSVPEAGLGPWSLQVTPHLFFAVSPTTTKSYRTSAWANESPIKDGLGSWRHELS